VVKNYLVIALRNLYRNKLYTVVNLVGLGVAMALCVGAYVNYEFGADFDSFHEKADQIHTINSYRLVDGNRQNWSLTPEPMAPAMASEIPGIKNWSRVTRSGGIMRHEEQVFNETFYYVDDGFFDMISFDIISGTEDTFDDHAGIIITEDLAQKYFGNETAVGKRMILSPDGQQEYDFVVYGVMAKPPKNSSMQPNVLVPYAKSADLRERDLTSWDRWTRAVLIETEPGVSIASIETQLDRYLSHTNEANPTFEMAGFYVSPLTELAEHSRNVYGGPFWQGMHPAAVYGPTVTAILVLLLACFNFINTSIAFSSRRLKEIGIRKVIGGQRGQLVKQFIGENLLLCLVSLVVAAALAEVIVPAYSSLWPDLELTMNYADNLGLVGFLVGLLLFTGLAAGAYPALYVSKFNPVAIFKGKQKLGGNNTITRILLTFQFALAMTTIIAAVVYSKNAEFIQTMELGFDRNTVLLVRVSNETEFEIMRNAVKDHPKILSVGGTEHLMGWSFAADDAIYEEERRRVHLFNVGENHFETMGFTLLEGRTFDSELAIDYEEAVIVNELLVEEFGWSSALDKYLTFEITDSTTEQCRVVGVVKNFYPNGVDSKLRPTVMRLVRPEAYTFLSVKSDPATTTEVAGFVQETFTRLIPTRPYDGFWQDETLADETLTNNAIRLVFLWIAGMVVIISGMGLFALVSLKIARRTKELGIRKILGATMMNISYLISRELLVMITLGCILASGLGYYLVDALCSSIWTYYTDFGVTPYLSSGLLVMGVAALTVGFQVYRVSSNNPVEAIRDE